MNWVGKSGPLQLLAAVIMVAFTVSFSASSGETAVAGGEKTIIIGGTGSAMAPMRLLGEQFTKKHPDITVIVLPSLGSAGGKKALLGGDLDISISSKALSADEQGKGLTAARYAKCPFVFLTHSSNKLSNITLQEVLDIYSLRTLAWPDETPVRIVTRPAGEINTILIERISEGLKQAVQGLLKKPGRTLAVNDQENADLLEKLPGSFGTGSLCQIITEKRSLNVLSFNGIKPGVMTLSDGTYPYFNEYYIITGPRSSPPARQFVDFVFSQPGRSLLKKNGHLTSDKMR